MYVVFLAHRNSLGFTTMIDNQHNQIITSVTDVGVIGVDVIGFSHNQKKAKNILSVGQNPNGGCTIGLNGLTLRIALIQSKNHEAEKKENCWEVSK